MSGYYDEKDLNEWGKLKLLAPEQMQKFSEYHRAVLADSKLSKKQKILIALSVAHALRCPYCIDTYTDECIKQGFSKEEMMEAVHVSAMVSAGSNLTHSLLMKKFADNAGAVK